MRKVLFFLLFCLPFIVWAQTKEKSLLIKLLNDAVSMKRIEAVCDIALRYDDIYNNIPTIMPLDPDRAKVSSEYGVRIDPITRTTKFHSGIDYVTYLASTVHAVADGMIQFSGRRGGYGNMIIIKHKFGLETRYAHLSVRYKVKNEFVRKGDIIGFVGSTGRSTGNHLHFEIRKNGKVVEPIILK